MAENLQNKILALLLGGSDSENIAALKAQLASALIESAVPPVAPALEPELQVQTLKQRLRLLTQVHRFEQGGIVKWKDGLRHKKFPAYGQPAIIVELLAQPVLDPVRESGSPYFHEKLDLRIGLLLAGDEYVEYLVASERFEPY